MVLAGQYLERPTLIARDIPGGEPLSLEGLFHRGSSAPAVVVCAPHPRMGGSMDSPVVAELAWALTQSGRATLRFNYQGVGASPGTVQAAPAGTASGPQSLSTVSSEMDDARAAVVHLGDSTDHHRVAIAGYSFGAAVALGLALEDPSLTHVILIAPPTSLFDFTRLKELQNPVLIVAGHRDAWVDRVAMAELAQQAKHARWEVIAGADHFFSQGLTELGKVVVRWMDQQRL